MENKFECSKCGKVYNEINRVAETSLCEDCFDLIWNEETKCSSCYYFYKEDDIVDDYPACKNKNSKYCETIDDYIPLDLKCDYFLSHNAGKLLEVKEICDKLANEPSRIGKENILKENENNKLFKEILKFLLNNDFVTGISTKKLNKNVEVDCRSFDNILDLLIYLEANNTGTDQDIGVVKGFVLSQDESLHEFLKQLITKKLKLGITKKTVNKVYPDF